MTQIFPETRMIRLADGEEIMTLAFFVFIQYRSVTDRRTDRQTDGHLCSSYRPTSACIACYANALVKIGSYLVKLRHIQKDVPFLDHPVVCMRSGRISPEIGDILC